MNFKQLIRLYESEIVFQHPGEDEELARDKVYSMQQFEKWFKTYKSKLIWNEQAQGYDSNTNIYLHNLGLSIIPVQFNIVKGDFYCNHNNLISLEGCPKEVRGNFNCSHNNLKSLKGCPKEVGDLLNFQFQNIGDFYCSYNQLESLEGCPEIINGSFNCSDNKLKSLKGSPKIIKGYFNCSYNQLESLEGCPKEIRENFNCSYNKVKFIKEQIRLICKVRGKIIT